MSTYPKSLDHMLAAWNEPDPSKVRAHLNLALNPNIRFVDPTIDVIGIDGFEENVHKVKTQLPNSVYSRTSGWDAQHGFYRYHWAIHQGDKLVLKGFDVVEIDDNDQVACVIGFFGDIPNL